MCACVSVDTALDGRKILMLGSLDEDNQPPCGVTVKVSSLTAMSPLPGSC